MRARRTWCLVALYGFCFGIELTVNNIITTYLFDQFDLDLTIAGLIGSLFGLMNLFARSTGGLVSDAMGHRFGMRGRLWAYWLNQTIEGVFCIFLGLAKDTLAGTIVLMLLFSFFVQVRAARGRPFARCLAGIALTSQLFAPACPCSPLLCVQWYPALLEASCARSAPHLCEG